MFEKHVCQVTHCQIASGNCPWCEAEFKISDGDEQTANGRSGKCCWNLASLNAALKHEDAEYRFLTVSNLESKHGPPLEIAVPLISDALRDHVPDVRRLAENALLTLGRSLSIEVVAAFENGLHGSPHELAFRILLAAHYFLGQRESPRAREARLQHVLWIIRSAPTSHTAGTPTAYVLERHDADCYAQAKGLWLEQVERYTTDATVIGNAANFFVLNDKILSEELFKSAKALEPQNPEWSRRLGHLYSLESRGETSDSAKYAKLAFQELQASERVRQQGALGDSNQANSNGNEDIVASEISARMHALSGLAKAAVAADEFIEAESLASELLTLAVSEDLPEYFRHDGNATFYGNLVLGQCQLRNGNVERAKVHLLASGRTKGSPNLCSFGPNMSLASALLANGERDVVLQFFDLCRVFWKSHTDELIRWSDQVQKGELPDFGANLTY